MGQNLELKTSPISHDDESPEPMRNLFIRCTLPLLTWPTQRRWRIKVIKTYHYAYYYPQWRFIWSLVWIDCTRPRSLSNQALYFESIEEARQFIRSTDRRTANSD